jgi:hypothetical protein
MGFNLRKPITLESLSGNKLISRKLMRIVINAERQTRPKDGCLPSKARQDLHDMMCKAISKGFESIAHEQTTPTIESLLTELKKNTELCEVIGKLGIRDSEVKDIAKACLSR